MLLFGFLVLVLLSQQHIWEVRDFALDLQAQISHTLPARSRQVTIVSIGEKDYRELFQDSSPLDDARLRQLLEQILRGNPAVLGVDIRTDDKKFASLRTLSGMDKVVWARAANTALHDAIEPGGVLGGGQHKVLSGLAVFPDDSEDSATRRYQRRVKTSEGALDTFLWAIVQKFQAAPVKAADNSRENFSLWDIRYTDAPARPERSASQILAPGFEWKDSIKGEIVLLGGRYDASDRHKTPYEGEMDGVDVLANAIETEINHRSQASFTWSQLFWLGAVEVPMLLALFHLRPYRSAMLLSLLLIVAAAPVYYLGLFQFWLYGSLIALGVMFEESIVHFRHQAIELAEERLRAPHMKS
jgi:CHASE2 domain-containing sensor protein